MRYKDLRELIDSSSSSRKYFLSLPVEVQIRLHREEKYIHSLVDLHKKAEGW